jgi:hypothetical protein
MPMPKNHGDMARNDVARLPQDNGKNHYDFISIKG